MKNLDNFRNSKANSPEQCLELVNSSQAAYVVVTPTQWAYLELGLKDFRKKVSQTDCLIIDGKVVLRIRND